MPGIQKQLIETKENKTLDSSLVALKINPESRLEILSDLLKKLQNIGNIYALQKEIETVEISTRKSLEKNIRKLLTHLPELKADSIEELPSQIQHYCKKEVVSLSQEFGLTLTEEEIKDVLNYYQIYKDNKDLVCIPPQFLSKFFHPEELRSLVPNLVDEEGVIRIKIEDYQIITNNILELVNFGVLHAGTESSFGSLIRSYLHYFFSLRDTNIYNPSSIEKFINGQFQANIDYLNNGQANKKTSEEERIPSHRRFHIPQFPLNKRSTIERTLASIGVTPYLKLYDIYKKGMQPILRAPRGSTLFITDLRGSTGLLTSKTKGISPFVVNISNKPPSQVLHVGYLADLFTDRFIEKLNLEKQNSEGRFQKVNEAIRSFFDSTIGVAHDHLARHFPWIQREELSTFVEPYERILKVPAGDGSFTLALSEEASDIMRSSLQLTKLLLYLASKGEDLPGLGFLKDQSIFLMASGIDVSDFSGGIAVGAFESPLDDLVQVCLHMPGMSFLLQSLKDETLTSSSPYALKMGELIEALDADSKDGFNKAQKLIEMFSVRKINDYSPDELYTTRCGLQIPLDLVPPMITTSSKQLRTEDETLDPFVNFMAELNIIPSESMSLRKLAACEIAVLQKFYFQIEEYIEPITVFSEPNVIKLGGRLRGNDPKLLDELKAKLYDSANTDFVGSDIQIELTPASAITSDTITSIAGNSDTDVKFLQTLLGGVSSFFILAQIYKKERDSKERTQAFKNNKQALQIDDDIPLALRNLYSPVTKQTQTPLSRE
jgi:hypothetical protein